LIWANYAAKLGIFAQSVEIHFKAISEHFYLGLTKLIYRLANLYFDSRVVIKNKKKYFIFKFNLFLFFFNQYTAIC
jgi:hypothetical protein